MGEPIKIQIMKSNDCGDVPMPCYMSEHAAGMDVCAACEDDITLAAGATTLVPCGFSMALPIGYEAQMRPRSGLALKHGIILPNSPGTIDADYRGEVCVILSNIGQADFVITRGMRIAQMVIASVTKAQIELAEQLGDTVRGEGGFGHTGV